MPRVTKQRPGQVPVRTGRDGKKLKSALDRIAPVKSITGGVKMNVYGRGKTGKTRLACTFPKPLLLMGTEDGTKSVVGAADVDFIMVEASSDLEELTEGVLAGGKYKTAVLDTAGGLQDLILKEVLGLEDVPVQKSWGMAERGDWMTTGAQWKERMRSILDLARKGLNVVVIAHERNFNEDSGASDVMFPSVGAALTPTVAGWLNGACDYICQTFIREEEEVAERDVPGTGKKVKTRTKTGRKEYCLRVGPHPVYMTGFRLPMGVELPEVIVDATYDKIADLISGEAG
jgi:hypothetical protein